MASLQVDPTDRDLMIRTIMGEAGGQDPEGMSGVANVIANRLASGKYGKTGSDVVLAPNQFEPWSSRGSELLGYDPNSDGYKNAGAILDGVLSGKIADTTAGATHFYAPKLQAQLGRPVPGWASGQGKLIAGQLYYAPQGAVTRATSAPASEAIADVTQPKAPAGPSKDTLKTWGLDDDAAPAKSVPAAPSPTQQPAPAPAPVSDTLKAWGLDDDEPAKPASAPAAPATPSATDTGTGSAFNEGVVNKIPLVGPALTSAEDYVGSHIGSLISGEPVAQVLAEGQARRAATASAHPAATTAGDITGTTLGYLGLGSIPGVGALLGGGTGGLITRALTGAAGNGLVGGADAYLRGDSPLAGAAFGAVGGAAAPAVGKVVGNVVGGIANKLSTLGPTGVPGLDRSAANLLTQVVNADDPAAVRASLSELGPLGTLADAGPSLQTLASGLSSKPGEARSAISGALTQRGSGRDNRLLGDIDTALGPAESPQTVTDAILAHRRLQDGVNYAIVHANAPPVDASGVVAKIDNLLEDATGNQHKALQNIRAELVKTPETADADGNVVPEEYHDSSRRLHNVRMDIDATLDGSAPGLGVLAGAVGKTSSSVVAVRNALDDALKGQVPGMTEADAASSMLADRANAVKSGVGLLDSGKTAITPSDFADARSGMDPGQAIAENKGLRGEINRLVGTKKNDLVALQGALQGQGGWNTAKLATAFGDQPTNDLLGSVNREARFTGTENELLKNSRTDRSAAARQLLDETDPTRINLMNATPTGLILQGAKLGIVNPLLDALTKQDNSARNAQIARALMAQGPARDALVNRLLPLATRQNAISAGGQVAGRMSDAVVNLLTRAAALDGRRAFSR